MEQTEISTEEWEAYCASFSQAHHGWLITLATLATAQLQEAPENEPTDADRSQSGDGVGRPFK
jgi:hypothetical protein